MLTRHEIDILDILSRKLLAKRREIESDAGEGNGVTVALQRLMTLDCVEMVEPMGEKCFVITKKGSKILKESRMTASLNTPER